jgi:hypothetical protein
VCDKVAVDVRELWEVRRTFLNLLVEGGGEGKEVDEVPWMEKNKDLEVEG